MAAAVFRATALALTCAACTSVMADERTFDGTRWHVTAIDGQPTPANGDYRVEFTRNEISGRFGCNGWGGRYGIVGDIMTVGEVRSTMMACPEPAMNFERGGFAVLDRPMQMRWGSERQLTLGNGAGSIELKRAP
jgi:heat shock protein HslJ